MTWHEWMINQLTSRGLWPEQAHLVVNRYVLDAAGEVMANRMSDDVEGYPLQLQAGVLLGLKAIAIEWIDENMPKHFARPMFLPEKPGRGMNIEKAVRELAERYGGIGFIPREELEKLSKGSSEEKEEEE